MGCSLPRYVHVHINIGNIAQGSNTHSWDRLFDVPLGPLFLGGGTQALWMTLRLLNCTPESRILPCLSYMNMITAYKVKAVVLNFFCIHSMRSICISMGYVQAEKALKNTPHESTSHVSPEFTACSSLARS